MKHIEVDFNTLMSEPVVHLQLGREADVTQVSDLLIYSLDELEAIATEKGGIRALLDEK